MAASLSHTHTLLRVCEQQHDASKDVGALRCDWRTTTKRRPPNSLHNTATRAWAASARCIITLCFKSCQNIYNGTRNATKCTHCFCSPQVFTVWRRERRNVVERHIGEHSDVHWWQTQVARQLVKRDVAPRAVDAHAAEAFVPRDPAYGRQWHLHDSAMSINVQPVWLTGNLGKGVLVTIVDDGLQFIHPDLAANWRADASYDFNDDDPDVTPDPRIDDHGTSAAGACCGVHVSLIYVYFCMFKMLMFCVCVYVSV